MALAAPSISLAKLWNCGLASASSRAFMRSASELRLLRRAFSSCSARNFASSALSDGFLAPFFYSFQVAAIMSFWRCEISLRRIVTASAATTASAGFLRLRVVALERLGLDEIHIGLGGVAGVLRGGVDA